MRHELIVPELGLREGELVLSLWLVPRGSEVTAGDRLVEVLADSVTVDLPAPASGILIKTLVAEDEPIAVGQTLGIIESGDESEGE
jgi:pyruvate/2-oxoglutarate dehydrogenase complex dihydrolipoamide acyltransferase (E2) component